MASACSSHLYGACIVVAGKKSGALGFHDRRGNKGVDDVAPKGDPSDPGKAEECGHSGNKVCHDIEGKDPKRDAVGDGCHDPW